MLRPLIPRLLCVASAALFASTPVAAQNTITLEGVVRGDGAPVVGAQITVRNIATAELSRTLTRATGEFRILGLYSGQYTVNVKAIGYRQRTDTVNLVRGSVPVSISRSKRGRPNSRRRWSRRSA